MNRCCISVPRALSSSSRMGLSAVVAAVLLCLCCLVGRGSAASGPKARMADAKGMWHTVTLPNGKGMAMPPIKALSDVLAPPDVPRYRDNLVIPTVALPVSKGLQGVRYQISAKPITQQVLPFGLYGATTVFAYGPTNGRLTQYSWPAQTIEAVVDEPVFVEWTNSLKDAQGNCLPSLTDAVDQTLHWANPPGGNSNRDENPCGDCIMAGNCATDSTCIAAASAVYTGPLPMQPHLHGQDTAGDESDGYPEAWFFPANCPNLPQGYATEGTFYRTFSDKAAQLGYGPWKPGSATFRYPNNEEPSAQWFHDHALGFTRLNTYAGLAGYYLLRKKPSKIPEAFGIPWPPPGLTALSAASTVVREIPLVIQDRAFYKSGKLYYPVNDLPRSDVLTTGEYHPFWVPEFFPTDANGNSLACIVVNGKTWPKVAVARSNYRLRLLNAANARTFKFFFSLNPPPADGSSTFPTASERIPFWVIGTDGGFMATPQQRDQVLMGPAERLDIIFDFRKLAYKGRSIYLRNAGPEGPYGSPTDAYDPPPYWTAQVMRFDVANTLWVDKRFSDGSNLFTGAPVDILPAPAVTRRFGLIEVAGPVVTGGTDDYPLSQFLGDVDQNGSPVIKMWADPVSANPASGATEDWVLINFTEDGHPIHIHHADFQLVSRQAITVATDAQGQVTYTSVGTFNAFPEEVSCLASTGNCAKDTIMVYAGTITTIRVTFPTEQKSAAGLFTWHCHLLEHEDNEMMRPYCVGPSKIRDPRTGQYMCPAALGR